MVHLEISHIIFILCYLCHIFSTFCNNFWNNHKNITVFEKDSWRLFKITFWSFNALHVMHANTYLHTLCTKNINTLYTSKDSYIFFFWKFMNNSVMLACSLMLSSWGNSFSIISTLNLKVQDIGALKESWKKYVCDVWKKLAPHKPKIQRAWFKSLTSL